MRSLRFRTLLAICVSLFLVGCGPSDAELASQLCGTFSGDPCEALQDRVTLAAGGSLYYVCWIEVPTGDGRWELAKSGTFRVEKGRVVTDVQIDPVKDILQGKTTRSPKAKSDPQWYVLGALRNYSKLSGGKAPLSFTVKAAPDVLVHEGSGRSFTRITQR